jgi:DNA invertase Pin-like site-specific DNA recombinase
VPNSYGYARVSSPHRPHEGLSLEAQHEALPKIAAERFPEHVYAGTFWDAQSASVLPFASRKEGEKLNSKLEKGDVLCVVEGSLIFRSRHDYHCSDRLYQARGIAVYLSRQDTALGAAVGNQVCNRVAKEPGFTSTRTLDAFDYLRSKGIWPSGRIPQGWRLSADRHLFPDEVYRAKVKRLYDIRELNCWSNTDLWVYCHQAGILNREGKPWDTRRLLEAFGVMRKGWALKGWLLGPEGYAVPDWHPSVALDEGHMAVVGS